MVTQERSVEVWSYDGEARRSLPQWAASLVQLGSIAATSRSPGQRLVIGVAVPNRAYAAVLAAAGAVAAGPQTLHSLGAGSQADRDEHFAYLCSLRPNTNVWLVDARKVAQFVCVDDTGDDPLIVVREPSTGAFHMFPKRAAHKVKVRGLRLDALLIGGISAIGLEVAADDLSVGGGGPLQALLKVDRYCRAGDRDSRSSILPSSGNLPERLNGAEPVTVVFDGTKAFRRWRQEWRRSSWIVVLDRSSGNFHEGVALVEEEYALRHCDLLTPALPAAPALEIFGFWTSR
jgi:hypothetical protein